MSDLFHDQVPDDFIMEVAKVMVEANWHIYQILTKRSVRMSELLRTRLKFAAGQQHIWWGVSVEDRRYGLPRIEDLRSAPAFTRFLSVEPLLEDLGLINLSKIHWVIVGGESGYSTGLWNAGGLSQYANSVAITAFLFLQAVGRNAQVSHREATGRSDVQ